MNKPRIMIATPTYTGEVVADFVKSLMAAQLYCAFHGVEMELNIADRYSLVQFARNRLAREFLADDTYTHILWLDADLGFDPTAIYRLLLHDLDVVGGAYPVKAFPPWFPIKPIDGEQPTDGSLIECSVAPTGFLLVKREAMLEVASTVETYTHYHQGQETVCPHIFDLELVDSEKKPGMKDLIGEDVVLCHRLRNLGYRIWIEPDISFRHVGLNYWGANLKQKNDADAEKQQRQPEVPTELSRAVSRELGQDLPPGLRIASVNGKAT